MSYGEPGDRVSASRRRLNEARQRDGLFSPASKECTHTGERFDCQSSNSSCSEKNSSGKGAEGGGVQHLVQSPLCDADTMFSDDTRPSVRKPTPPDGGRGEGGGGGRNASNDARYRDESKQDGADGTGQDGWSADNALYWEESKLNSADDMREDGRNANDNADGLYCEESKQNSSADDRRKASNRTSGGISNRESSSRCVLEEDGRKWGSAGGTSGSSDGLEAPVFIGDGDSKEKSVRLRVAGEFVGNVFNECSSTVASSTAMSLK